jgi:hypothetical protein
LKNYSFGKNISFGKNSGIFKIIVLVKVIVGKNYGIGKILFFVLNYAFGYSLVLVTAWSFYKL